MDIHALAQNKYILWGANWSLYSAKVRPYLMKKGISYVELNPSHPHFYEKVMPQIGHFSVPVIETPEGDIVADSTEIMEFFESRYPEPRVMPEDKTMAVLAWLIHSYGSEGLHKPAMYFRWNTTRENRLFIIDEFSRSLETKSVREEAEVTAGKKFAHEMRSKYLPVLGIGLEHDVDTAIHTSTEKLYDVLHAHFLEYPYLLGGRPSFADFGMMAPLYAHLGRDISSNNDLKRRAPALYRWIETMNRHGIVDPEVWHVEPEYFEVSKLPETLMALLRLICADYGPEILATADLYHEWLRAVADRPAGTVISFDEAKANHQVLGEIEHVQQGVLIKRMGMLDALTHHQRLTAIIDEMNGKEQQTCQDVLHSVGGDEIFALRLERPMVRDNYAYVLA